MDGSGLTVIASWVALGMAALGALLVWAIPLVLRRRSLPQLEISEAELGIGSHKLTLKPNHADAQIAYQLWVEVSTRKIGLPIDLEHDVIAEVYDSWYEFFKVTRELIKSLPATKVRRSQSTQDLVHIAVEVLNEGLRPHLTTWQARFRRWYERALSQDSTVESAPQDVQKRFPEYDELVNDLLVVNQRLIHYRTVLKTLGMGQGASHMSVAEESGNVSPARNDG